MKCPQRAEACDGRNVDKTQQDEARRWLMRKTNSGPAEKYRPYSPLAFLSYGLSFPRLQVCPSLSLYNCPLSQRQRAPHPRPMLPVRYRSPPLWHRRHHRPTAHRENLKRHDVRSLLPARPSLLTNTQFTCIIRSYGGAIFGTCLSLCNTSFGSLSSGAYSIFA